MTNERNNERRTDDIQKYIQIKK